MIMPKSSDLLQTGLCTRHGIRWCHADVTDSARALSQAHLSGPTAALVLGEALAGVALLSHELTRPGETLSFGMRVKGPVQGMLVEAAQDGALRGYTPVKILNDLDDREEIVSSVALGESGTAHMIRSLPGQVISRVGLDVAPPGIQETVNRYLNHSLQRAAFAVIRAFAYEGGIDLARAFLVECLPDGDRREFERLRVCAKDGSLQEALEMADGASGVCEELNMNTVRVDPPRPLRFACRCSTERAQAALAALQPAELREMAAAGKPTEIFCHLCGRRFSFDAKRLAQLADGTNHPSSGESTHA
jgi:molecular chaperone Hsp33